MGGVSRSMFLKRMKLDYQLYLIIGLPLMWLIAFKYVPLYGVQLAFKKFNPIQGILGSQWVGLDNFDRFFNSFLFERLVGNTLGISLYEIIAGFPVPIIMALALHVSIRGTFRKTVQYTVYLPHFVSTVVMVGIILQFLSPRVGIVNMALQWFGMDAIDFIGSPEYFKSIFVWSGIWQNAGWGTIIYLATLAGVDNSLHEAATVDGASRFKRVIHIDIPAIVPTMIILLILQVGHMMNVGFEKVLLLQNPVNLEASEVISTYVYKIALTSASADFSFSTAIGLFNSIINFILLISINKLARKVSDTSLW
jgi:putative aldouronate transport system permease protein